MGSYNTGIPVGTDAISKSARQIKANFKAIDQAFSNNHIGFTQDESISGKHDVLVLRPQAADPVTSTSQIAIYQKITPPVTGVPQLFYAPSNGQTPIQLTYPKMKVDGSTSQYSFVAGPFIIYGGKISVAQAAVSPIPVNLSPGTTLLSVDLEVDLNTQFIGLFVPMAIPTNIAGTSFNITFENIAHPAFDVLYMAIGV